MKSRYDRQIAKQVLEKEAQAILVASQRLGDSFDEAVDLLFKTKGRVVVTGLGKSGHIARKIAASFASTGTAAYFLHPSEALHGDSGVLLETDCLLAIAQSGETIEILKLVEISRSKKIPVLAVTGNLDSSLARLSSVTISSAVESEADPYDIVPTCSSTVALALGDSLVVSLMHMKNFQVQDFASLHPSGALGKRLSSVEKFMCSLNETALKTSDIFDEVLSVITKGEHGLGCVLGEDGSLLGVITDGDLRRAILKFKDEIFIKTASDLMTKNPVTIDSFAKVEVALLKMRKKKITSLFVTDERKRLIGIVKLQDIGS